MNVTAPSGAIVVGVDASLDSDRAVTWALGLAGRTKQPVHFVHVQPSAPSYVVGDRARVQWEEAGRTLLDTAVAQAEQVSGVGVTTQTVHEAGVTVASALIEVSRDAMMLVVGARGHGGFSGLLAGSVSQHAARHANCPVVAVRASADPSADRVVVGVDDSDGAEDALALAFELAAHRAAPLTAIHAWHAPSLHGAGVVLAMPGDVGTQKAEQQQALQRLLAPWELKYPAVHVTSEVIPGHPAEALSVASEHAVLVVVGSRGRGAFAGMLLGSVSQEVLQRARCPVLVAR